MFATPRKGDIDCSSNTARTSPLTRLRSIRQTKAAAAASRAPAEFAGKLAPTDLPSRIGGGIFLNQRASGVCTPSVTCLFPMPQPAS